MAHVTYLTKKSCHYRLHKIQKLRTVIVVNFLTVTTNTMSVTKPENLQKSGGSHKLGAWTPWPQRRTTPAYFVRVRSLLTFLVNKRI